MPDTMQQARDWQEDMRLVTEVFDSNLPGNVIARYWLQQYKKKAECYSELARIISGHNCDHHYWKSRYYVVNAERAKEKQRADEAEKRLSVIKNALNSWREIYAVDGLEEERKLTEDVLKIIEMLEVMEVEDSTRMRGEDDEGSDTGIQGHSEGVGTQER
ncbi:hypothetical protein FLT15_17530 [Paenibacillus thiaminolyticus]|uniref:hypothetical protein n=1 Tax=Paenibacillus thiaminolyticus TaxID=49283 RepID=UPI0013F669BE|nr:hypothetical protein [Paenibacillus thiaminolyticus]NGP60075.1 hypothetical protein [Paenibacillus thiaminolyticus]